MGFYFYHMAGTRIMIWYELQKKARLRLLQLHYESKSGHLGGNLSCLDILLYLHHYVMKPDDVFILSKGHSAGSLYVVLWTLGKIADDELKTFHKDGTYLCSHITAKHSPFGTGSLGHGLSLAVGMAMAKKIRGESGKVYCLLSDGELDEGSTQEALRTASYTTNLIGMIDMNGWKGFDRSIGQVGGDGHNFDVLEKEFNDSHPFKVFRTIKGRATHYENMLESHYLPLNAEQYEEACNRV